MATREDIEGWLARAALGDRRAFGPLYDATSAKMFGICLRLLHDRAEAEDALQEVYAKVWRGAGRYAANGLSPITWMAAVARNHCIDRLRAARARGERGGARGEMPDEAALADGRPGAEDAAVARGEAARVVECLGQLEEKRGEAVRRAYLEGETYAELAARFGVPLNTMRSWLRRSLIALRECLEQ
ncbi:sigma-70 family RNA polymerase sigma factor [Jannaschia sp. W003]|uniref:sigma-70 family RNA polymerase sigma factor n=1 Tax=Jannaschia sp. W003 TaxID=2867012 RepID=UPI0021A597D0|nr:sigma-70 family RNA polymerase sigma factor [Jannaschia sp. W003]UWQ21069.1 sigma-70 family RNA polymerase sigma factor [Jannaschia sp. W003]